MNGLWRVQRLRGLSFHRRFLSSKPVIDKETLMETLRDCVKRDVPPPLAVNSNYRKVVAGERRMVQRDDTFNFSCTACGSCCRIYPADVMLDPHDLYLISRSESLQTRKWRKAKDVKDPSRPRTTGWLFARYHYAFTFEMGLFERNQQISELAPDSYAKLAPVCFLSPDNQAHKCWFADSSVNDIDAFKVDEEGKPIKRGPRTGLRCSLGRENQPMPCASYPLGELYEDGTNQFWSLDDSNCEGTRVEGAMQQTVGDYYDGQGLGERRRQWEWFRELASTFAEPQYLLRVRPTESELGTQEGEDALRLVFHMAQRLWYNFDSIPLIEKSTPADWGRVRGMLEELTRKLGSSASKHISSNTTSEDLTAFVSDLEDEELL